MGIVSQIEPKSVFKNFEKIASIPHGSGNEKELSDYIVAFAKDLDLEVYQDKLNNLIIKKEATPGYENKNPIILQGHLDMVCDKVAESKHDFEKDGLELLVDGDFLTANGTTLGGDDGIAVAYIMAILESKNIDHPALEMILTVSEEVGLDGAKEIDLSLLKANQLINLDSEEEGFILTSCAGGCRINLLFSPKTEEKSGTILEISISGLLGGHSGIDIDKNRANANVLLVRLLREVPVPYDLISVIGGSKDNVIPNNSSAKILINASDLKKTKDFVRNIEKNFKTEFEVSEKTLQLTTKTITDSPSKVLDKNSKDKFILLSSTIPNGIVAMSQNISNLVQTSLNFGVLEVNSEIISLKYALRSSIDSEKTALASKIEFIAKNLEVPITFSGIYPAWSFRVHSPLRDHMVDTFEKFYGHKPTIKAIHAGLECGLFSDKIANLDAVSIGPTMLDVHTPNEKLSISSTKKTWEYLLEVLRTAK